MTEDGRRDDRILTMIGAAVLAGAYQALAREMPEASPGLMKLAAKHSARAATLAGEVAGMAVGATPRRV